MPDRSGFVFGLVSVWLGLVLIIKPGLAMADPELRVFVLLESAGYVHDVTKPTESGGPSVIEQVWTELAEEHGWEVTFSRDAADLAEWRWSEIDQLVLYTTGPIPLDTETLEEWVRGGGALLGIHCAADTRKDDPVMKRLLGAVFRDHPWTAEDTVTVRVDDPGHPACKPYAPAAEMKEEIYRFREPLGQDERVLMSLDTDATEKKVEPDKGEQGQKNPEGVPIAWCRPHGAGRVFYTSLGHREDVWRSAAFRDHLEGAVKWLRDGRPRDPWVFRSVLNGRARTVTIALHDHLWLAYDAASGAWVQAWRGDVDFVGTVWDGRHGPQPVSRADAVYFRATDPAGWWLLKDGEPIETTARFGGYRFADGQVTLTTRLTYPGGDSVVVTETPEAENGHDGKLTWVRHVEVRGLPEGAVLQTTVPTPTVAPHLAGDPGMARLTATTSATLITVTDDGVVTLALPVTPGP